MNLRLVPPSEEYAEVLHRWRNEAGTLRFNPVKARSIEALREVLVAAPRSLRPVTDGHEHRWFIEVDALIVGTVSLSTINMMMGTAEVGYMIGEEYKGRGIATLALRAWTAKVFTETDLRKLTASVADGNHASLRVLEKVGYSREGLLREHYLVQGVPTNEVMFGLLRREWKF